MTYAFRSSLRLCVSSTAQRLRDDVVYAERAGFMRTSADGAADGVREWRRGCAGTSRRNRVVVVARRIPCGFAPGDRVD